jgi:putative MATE family efflux protein
MSNVPVQTGRDLTSGSIIGNLVMLSLPIMMSNFMQTFYDLANAFWLGKLGEKAKDALSATGISNQLLFFLLSFGIGFVIAGTALVSRYKGAGEPEKIRKIVGQLIFLLLTFVSLLVILGVIFTDQILGLLDTPVEIFDLAHHYLRIILVATFFMFTFFAYQSVSHGLGDTVTPMKIQIIAASTNLIIDPFLIFGLLIFPRMETIGAGYATLIARILASVLGIYYFRKKAGHLVPSLREIYPDWNIIKTILKVSIPSSLAISTTSFGFLFLQRFVNSFGTVVISVNSVGSRMTNIFMMPAMGLSNGLAAIIGQNLGAKNIKRAEDSFVYAIGVILAIMIVGCSLVYFYAGELTHFFVDDAEVIEVGQRMFKLTAIAAFVFGIIFVFNGLFNGSGDTKVVFLTDTIRLWIIRIPLVYILSGKLLELEWFSNAKINAFLASASSHLSAHPYDSLWWSMVYSNIITAIAAFLIFKTGRWKRVKL